MGMCSEKKTLIGWRGVWNMRWRSPDQEVDQRRHGERLCIKIAKHVTWMGRMLWIIVDARSWQRLDDDQDGGWVSVSSGTGSPGSPGQRAVKRSWFLVHGQVTIIFVVSVGLSVCLCRVFLSRLWSDFDETWTYVTRLALVVSPRIWGLGDP